MKTNNATELNQPLYTPAQTQAFGLYLRQHKPAEVAQRVGVAERTVQQWITEKYNVVYMAMDMSGVGSAVAELVRKFYPGLDELDYSPEMKRMMVYKAREIINDGRLQFDAEWDDLVHSFLMIRQQTTKASNQITFISNRSKVGSHADLAWASMHVMRWEPIDIHNDDDTTVSFF